MPRARNSGKRAIRPKKNRKTKDLNQMHNALKILINRKEVYESNAKRENYASIFIFFLLIISLSLIIAGGIFKNLYSIGSGSILLIFLWVLLK